jgi:signal transduction histidine kinase
MSVILRLISICCIGFLLAGSRCSTIKTSINETRHTAIHAAPLPTDTLRVHKLCQLSRYYLHQDVTKAMGFANQALTLSQQCQWNKGKLMSYNLISSCYLLNGTFDVLRELANETLKLAEETGLAAYAGHAKRFVGEGYAEYREIDSARINFDSAIKIFDELGEDSAKAVCLESVGSWFREQNRFDSAMSYYKPAYAIFERIGSDWGKASILQNQGFLQIRKHDYHAAEAFFKKSLQIYANTNSLYGRLTVLNDLANTYNLLEKYELSAQASKEALELSKLYHSDQQTNWAIESLAKSYKGQNRLIEAMQLLEKVNYSKRRLYVDGLERQFTMYQLMFDNEQMGTVIQKKTIDDQRKVQQALLVFLLFILGLAAFLWFNNKKLRQKNAEIKNAMIQGQTIERKRVAAELHDNLGGTLASLNWYLYGIDKKVLSTEEQKIYERVHQMVGSAYKEVRSLSHNLMPAELEEFGLVVALSRLVDKLNDNKMIEFKFTDSFEDRRLSGQEEFELYSIILELTNNILKHSGANRASIELSENPKSIFLVVSDNGTGIPGQVKQGMGLGNVQNRVQTLSGKIDISAREGKGTMIEIEIPKNGSH